MVDNRREIERRQFPRLVLEKSTNYRIVNDSRFYNGLVKNISAGGIKLLSFNFIPKDREVIIEVQLDYDFIKTNAVVAWVKQLSYSGRYEIGLKFIFQEENDTIASIDDAKGIVSKYVEGRLS